MCRENLTQSQSSRPGLWTMKPWAMTANERAVALHAFTKCLLFYLSVNHSEWRAQLHWQELIVNSQWSIKRWSFSDQQLGLCDSNSEFLHWRSIKYDLILIIQGRNVKKSFSDVKYYILLTGSLCVSQFTPCIFYRRRLICFIDIGFLSSYSERRSNVSIWVIYMETLTNSSEGVNHILTVAW